MPSKKQPRATKPATPVGLTLPPRLARALDVMLDGGTNTEVAAELGVDRVTVWRWRSRPEVIAILEHARRARVTEIAGRLQDAAHCALDLLVHAVRDDRVPIAVRVRAAAELLDRVGFSAAGVRGIQRDALHDAEVMGLTDAPFAGSAGPPTSIDREEAARLLAQVWRDERADARRSLPAGRRPRDGG